MKLQKSISLLILTLYSVYGIADNFHQPSKYKNAWRFSKVNVGVLYQIYTRNTYHSAEAQYGMSYLFGYHNEFALNKQKQNKFISIGIEWMHHSFSYSSYYFYPDSIKLYTGNMNYRYYASMNELNFPIQYKYCFSRENNDIHGMYFCLGYIYRVTLLSHLSASFKGSEVNSSSLRPPFKIGVLSPYANSYAGISVGYQKNNPLGRMRMFMELYARYSFSPFLINTDYTANSLYFNNYTIGIALGVKWF